jgi:hypothetical protein
MTIQEVIETPKIPEAPISKKLVIEMTEQGNISYELCEDALMSRFLCDQLDSLVRRQTAGAFAVVQKESIIRKPTLYDRFSRRNK